MCLWKIVQTSVTNRSVAAQCLRKQHRNGLRLLLGDTFFRSFYDTLSSPPPKHMCHSCVVLYIILSVTRGFLCIFFFFTAVSYGFNFHWNANPNYRRWRSSVSSCVEYFFIRVRVFFNFFLFRFVSATNSPYHTCIRV